MSASLEGNLDVMLVELGLAEQDCFFDQVVDSDLGELRFSLLNESPYPAGDRRRPVGLLANLFERGDKLFIPVRRFPQPHQASASIVGNGMKRLV